VATAEDPGELVDFARDLAELIRGVRAIDPQGRAFSGRGRGGDLRSPDARMSAAHRCGYVGSPVHKTLTV